MQQMSRAWPQASAGPNPSNPPNFDRLAPIYRWLEWLSFGPSLTLCRRAFLGRFTARRRALIIGDGDGRFTASLLGSSPGIEIDAIDASPEMLRALTGRAGPNRSRVHTQAMDARQWRPPEPRRYDLVCTHFFLDCLTTAEIRFLAAAVRPALQPGALWVVSEFSIPPGPFGSLIAAPLVSALYRAFGWLTGLAVRRLPDHQAALRHAGFILLESRPWLHGLLASELWALTPDPSDSHCEGVSGPG
jgi:SAM-dependent methyltransferase